MLPKNLDFSNFGCIEQQIGPMHDLFGKLILVAKTESIEPNDFKLNHFN